MHPQRRTALVSVAAAALLVVLKLATGLASGSLGLVSEALHSGTDLVAALLTFFAVGVAVRPADPELRCNLLGMTETGSVSLYGDGDTDLPERKRGCFGRPVPGIEARVVAPVAAGTGADVEEGELWVRGPNVMQGYHGRERWQCFDDAGWFHTGDFVRVDDDGDFFFRGRGGDIIRTANVTLPD